ncbi:helix-turn-helix transcriptional regulator [Crocinitomicaceae bacterium]|nr:helix-turn-helix transcriptional regulator [Crocinitomicaceae bacterium]MDC1186629.1 helix-turn-helix transcriptional regulator [Crocinitomicaceae bacterium]
MEIYNGPHLFIKHEEANSRLISTWTSSPSNDLAYRKELIEHLHIAEKIKPSQIMWLLENLTFKVSDVTKKWVDENISKPIFKAGFTAKNQDGFDQVAFVVGQDVLAYIETMDIFNENSTSGFNPQYFATETEARNWLNEKFKTKDTNGENQKLAITFKGIDDNGKAVFELREQSSKFDSTVNLFKTIIEQNNFMKNNVEKYSSLTPREKEVLKFIIKGYTNKQISEKMHVSHHTIRTHRNRIWKKLDITQVSECLSYQYFFV